MTQKNDKTPNNNEIEEDVERLREWLSKQPHLPHDVDEKVLKAYVCGTKSLEIAKQKIDAYFTSRGRTKEIFSYRKRNPFSQEWKEGSEAVKMYFLPKATPEGYRVLMFKVGKDFTKFNHAQKIARTTVMIELAMELWPEMSGMIICFDLEGTPGTLAMSLNLPLTAAAIHWMQGTTPLKLKKVFVIKAMPFVETIVTTLIKPFIKEKLYKRITVTKEGETILKKHIPEDLLPADYGGKERHTDQLNEEWLKIVESREDWLKKMDSFVSDEKKRPVDENHTYGVEGTFRSLAID